VVDVVVAGGADATPRSVVVVVVLGWPARPASDAHAPAIDATAAKAMAHVRRRGPTGPP
jgi:hypothetical protein